jgi:hypothetical protein
MNPVQQGHLVKVKELLRVALLPVVLLAAFTLSPPSADAAWTSSSLVSPGGVNSTQFLGIACKEYFPTGCVGTGKASNSSWVGMAMGQIWNGSTWTYSGALGNFGGKNGVLNGVSCDGNESCVSVGSFGSSLGVPEMWAQLSAEKAPWATYILGKPAGSSQGELNDVSCQGKCMAVGYKMVSGDDKTYAVQFDRVAETWLDTKSVEKSNATLKGISCTEANFCVAVGSAGTGPLAEIWNGKSWSAPAAQPPVPGSWESAALNSINCLTTSWCMASGTLKRNEAGTSYFRPFADIWSAGTWSTTAGIPWGSNTNVSAQGISCRTTESCWIVGEGQSGTKRNAWGVHSVGSSWVQDSFPLVPNAEGAQLRDVYCGLYVGCKAVGWSLFGGTPIALVESGP